MGIAYGLLMNKSGFSFYWSMLMAMTIFSGSVEFVAVKLLLSPFNLVQSFVIALFICARHLFYGMCDETFSVNYTARGPKVWTTGGLCFG